MAHAEGERLLAAWTPPEFASAVDEVARAANVSRSELIRIALAVQLLKLASPPSSQTD